MKKLILPYMSFVLLLQPVFADTKLESSIEKQLISDKNFFNSKGNKKVNVLKVKAKQRSISASPLKELLSYLPNINNGDSPDAFDFTTYDIEVETDKGVFELTCNSSHYFNCGYFSLNDCSGGKYFWVRNGSRKIVYDDRKKFFCENRTTEESGSYRPHDETRDRDLSSEPNETGGQDTSSYTDK